MAAHLKIKDLTPTEVSAKLRRREIVLVDVREPAEYGAERIHGALNFPLSTFDPKALPEPGQRTIVFQCGSGKRSATAVERCLAQGLPLQAHMAGGISAWRAAGLPTISLEPNSGAVKDHR